MEENRNGVSNKLKVWMNGYGTAFLMKVIPGAALRGCMTVIKRWQLRVENAIEAQILLNPRYFAGRSALTAVYEVEGESTEVSAWTDTDWCSEAPGRRDMSGDISVIVSYYVPSWARTQAQIAESSAEAENVASIASVRKA